MSRPTSIPLPYTTLFRSVPASNSERKCWMPLWIGTADASPSAQKERPAMFAETSSSRSMRSEEHTSELQSRGHLVCRLLLEKKKKRIDTVKMHKYIIPLE